MRLPLLLATLLAAPAALAADITHGALTLSDIVARETPKGARAGAGFLTITNTGTTADTLLRVEADFPRVEIHETRMSDGIASMQEIGALIIEPGATQTLMPGGKHVMFMGLTAPLSVGATIPATLVFEQAGPVPVTFTVLSRDALMPKHGHANHADHK